MVGAVLYRRVHSYRVLGVCMGGTVKEARPLALWLGVAREEDVVTLLFTLRMTSVQSGNPDCTIQAKTKTQQQCINIALS